MRRGNPTPYENIKFYIVLQVLNYLTYHRSAEPNALPLLSSMVRTAIEVANEIPHMTTWPIFSYLLISFKFFSQFTTKNTINAIKPAHMIDARLVNWTTNPFRLWSIYEVNRMVYLNFARRPSSFNRIIGKTFWQWIKKIYRNHI